MFVKATGIVRRIDDLGRVVIPKEIRRTMRIREGDPLEIYIDREGEIILKKYSPIAELRDFSQAYVESLHQSTGHVAMITDRDMVIAVAGASENEWRGREVSAEVDHVMVHRRTNTLPLVGQQEGSEDRWPFSSAVVAPIIAEGDPVGAVLLGKLLDEGRSEDGSLDEGLHMESAERKLVETAAGFLARQLES